MLPIFRVVWWLAAWAALLGPLSAAADPPARVGRLSLAEGAVSFRIQGQGDGGAAAYNWPISSGAILDTGGDGRAEVQVGSSVFRLAGDSSIEFTVVDDSRVALQAVRGTLALTLRERDQADRIEIGIPGGQVQVSAPGRYRIDVDDRQGIVQISCWEGSAHIYRPGGELGIPGARRAVIYGSGGWFLDDLRQGDDFDRWADARDVAGNAPQARRYVSPEMTGYEDLDRYGDWNSAPDYGAVWYPRAVPAGWAPYRYGRWAWVPPWGWTWVDEAPWGFAPFHYGRWSYIGGRWGWVPGGYIRRPVYAPALVAWIGSPGGSVGFGFGQGPAVGWFPLAPREVFIPAYRSSPAYVRRANIDHVKHAAIIDRALANPHAHAAFAHRTLPQAVTVVPANVVRSGSAITPAQVRQPDQRELTRAPVTAQAPAATWLPPAEAARRPRHDGGESPPATRPGSAFPSPAVSTKPPGPGTAGFQAPGPVAPMAPHAGRHEERTVASPAALPAPVVTISPPSGQTESGPVQANRRSDRPEASPPPPRQGSPASPPAMGQPAPRPDIDGQSAVERFHERSPGRPAAVQAQPLPQPQKITPAAPPNMPVARESAPRQPAAMPRFESRPERARDDRGGSHDRGKPRDAR